ARTLVFSYILPTAGWIRDLHSLERAPAGRTRNGALLLSGERHRSLIKINHFSQKCKYFF
ncbi:MAG: hypothetical protein KH010_11020, partial [Hungatella hathewayi]|nr:hypothetical protein [Hungatella hathewayi]